MIQFLVRVSPVSGETLGGSMTWYAHHIYLPATDSVLRTLTLNAQIRPFLYLVRDLHGFRWHTPEVKHTLGPVGVVVVRPVASEHGHWAEWYDEPILPWESLQPTFGMARRTHVEGEQAPPASLLQFLSELSAQSKAPAMYYSTFMWGGDVEFEASWVLTPQQHTYITQSSTGSGVEVRGFIEADGESIESVERGDALRKGLAHLGIDLPTGFFAPHTRAFPWAGHHLG